MGNFLQINIWKQDKNSLKLVSCLCSRTSGLFCFLKTLKYRVQVLIVLLISRFYFQSNSIYRNSPPEVFLTKGVLKICSKFTEEHPCQSAISIKLQSNFIEIVLWHGCFPVNWLHIFRTPFPKNTPGWLLLDL